MTEREKHIEMAQRLGLVGMRPHLDGIYIDALAAFAKLVADDARATPALPQGVEEFIRLHGYERVWNSYTEYCVSQEDLRDYLSGMAIVPVEPTLEMINAALPHAMRESDEEKYRAIGEIICIWDEMLAAAKEKGYV